MKKINILTCLIIALTANLYSDEGANRKEAWLDKLDTNNDGKISKQEYLDKWAPMFGKRDADKDNHLNVEEWVTLMSDKSESISRKTFTKYDLDADKKISKAEYTKFRTKVFDASDTNSDGYWAESEKVKKQETESE